MIDTVQDPHSQPLCGSLMWAVRGAPRLVRPIKMYGFRSKRKRFALQTIHFYGVLNNYK